MKKKLTRRQAQAWLRPMRSCFHQMLSGHVDSIQGYAVTRLHSGDDYVRIDYCIAGTRALLARLLPAIDTAPLARIERKLAAGVVLCPAELQHALATLNQTEDALIGLPVASVKSAVLTEQIGIELEQAGLKEAA
jgi:hypothetical protein